MGHGVMRHQRSLPLIAAAVSATLWAYACGDGTTEPPPYFPEPTTVTLSPATTELTALGATVQLSAEVRDQNGQAMAGAAVTWSSGDGAVATVSATGLVTAVANGTATITATAGSASGSATVTVAQEVSAVVVTPDTALVLTGDTLRLAATATDANEHAVTGVEFVWASGDTAVALVDASGLVAGVTVGEVQVTATGAGLTGRAELTVAAPLPTTVVVTPDTVVLTAVGQAAQLAAEVRDQAGRVMADAPVTWASADTTVAVVDSAGVATAAGSGATTITATAGGAVGAATVTVMQSAGSVVVTPPADTIAPGDSLRLAAEAFDANGHVVQGADFAWSSSAAAVATVDPSGLVRGAAEGTATITATAEEASGTSEITVVNPDRAALVALYNATDGPNWVDNTNWLTDAPLGEWYGVDTDRKGRVVRLNLSGSWDHERQVRRPHGLRGPIPPELGGLSNLERLNLGYNALSGSIPSELGGLSNLRYLHLGYTDLSGSIPSELGELSNLEVLNLYLGFGGFSGPIPRELGNLANLRSLSLGPGLDGPIPPELGGLSNLVNLFITWNNLSGPIPPWLGQMENLRTLELISNGFTGPIPPELGKLTKLEALSLYNNDLTGPLPAELGNLVNLRSLRIASNRLTSTIPRTFLSLSSLEFLDWDCGIRGICVPGTPDFVAWVERMGDTGYGSGPFCNASDQAVLTRLFEVAGGSEWTESRGWLASPALEEWHGVETDSLGRVTALTLSGNGLSGELPAGLANLGHLKQLRINSNELGGRLPLALTALDLETLHYDGTDLCEPADAEFRDWLDGIPSHRGTAVPCAPLTDRDALVAVYESSVGPGWTNSDGWLSEAPLRRWSGVEVDAQGRVVGLNLRSNDLSGVIPPELGGLSNLERLDLAGNDLSGAIPPELGGLSNLRYLLLNSNDLSGVIPPELGGLSNLENLSLTWNDLSGAIPPELGGLSNLRYLLLSSNDLSGAIPPELGGLSNLYWLDLAGNDLSGAIPPELGGLSNLYWLDLAGNDLSGAIPPELGDLASLYRLNLQQNDFSGPVPSTFAGLARLSRLELSHNSGLAGAIPAGLRGLGLESLLASGTDLCVTRGRAFEEWLATIPKSRIALCGEPPAAYLVQAVQSRAHPVPLVAGEDALLRVFVTAAMETTEGIPEVRARFYLNGTERHVADIPGSSTPIPTEIDEGDLAMSANAEIPGRIVRPGLEMVVEIDPVGVLDPGLGVPRRIPEEGRLAVEVREMPTLDLTVIPFLWNSDPDSAIIGLVEDMEADPEGHHLLEDTRALLPVGGVDVTVRAPVASTSNRGFHLLEQTEAIRLLEGGGGHYMGMMSGPIPAVFGGAGVAYLSGRSNFSRPNSSTIAHELGHNMSLAHAPCGGAGGPDPSFPYSDGFIGAWGYNSHGGRLVSPESRDHMSYCEPAWTSDYHFTNALRYRLADEGATAVVLAAAPVRSLLLWGGVDKTGTPFFNPAFVVDASPALPDSAGDYNVTGRDASGRELFSLSFAMPVALSEEAEVSSFVFALPAQPGWADALASVTLSGPAGTLTLDGDSDVPMAILRDPRTGQVRGFLRDPSITNEVAADAVGVTASGLEVLFSRGIPGGAAWKR